MVRPPWRRLVRGVSILCLVWSGCGEEPPPAPIQPPPQAPEVPPEAAVTPAAAPPEAFFADVIWARGIPAGVVPLTPSRARHQTHYRVEEDADTVEVTEVLADGEPGRVWRATAGPDGSRQVVHVGPDGAVVQTDQLVEDGAKVTRQDGASRQLDAACALYHRELDTEGRTITEACVRSNGEAISDRHGVARRSYVIDALGRPSEERFKQPSGQPIAPLDRLEAGVRRVWDDHGQLIQRLRLDGAGQPLTAGMVASEEWDYDDVGRLVEHRYEDATGNLLVGPNGWAVETRRVTVADGGEETVILTLDTKRSPSRRGGDGVARAVEKRDAAGRLVSRAVFDAAENPTVEGEARAHRVTVRFDAAGRQVDVAWFGVGGRPTLHAVRGIHRETITRDDVGREVARACVDGLGQMVAGPQGWARRTQRWNSKGQLDQVTFEGANGEQVGRVSDGVSRLFNYYDLHGHLAQVASSGPNGKPMAGVGGFGRAVWEYDDAGRVTVEAWFDLIESAVINPAVGCARIDISYDAASNEKSRRCRDASGAPIMSSVLGAAGVTWERNGRGQVVRETWLGIDDKPMMTSHGHAVRVVQHDARGAVRTVSFLDTAGRPTFGREGWAEKRWVRDAQGRVLSVQTVDTLGNLVPDITGVAEVRTTRTGRLTKTRFMGADGQPTGVAGGIAGRDLTRDSAGHVLVETTVDVTGLPIRDPRSGCATVKTAYTPAGEIDVVRCLDPQGLPGVGHEGWTVRRHQWDIQGREIAIRRENTQEELISGKDGWAREVRVFDDRGWLIRRTREGVDGTLVGVTRVIDRDAMGRIVRERSVGIDDTPMMNDQGWSTRRLDYDALGRLASDGYAGTDGQPTKKQTARTRYGIAGRVAERRWLAPRGEVAVGPDGWAIERLTYDDRGHLVGRRFFDPTNKPGLTGYAHVGERHVRDAMGRLIERRAMAARDLLTDGFGEDKRHWAIERQRFDVHGRRVSKAVYDVEDRPVLGDDGFHLVTWKWSERGLLLAQERFLAPTRPAPAGWARQDHAYDRFGRLTTIRYQDAMGQAGSVWNGVGLVQLTYGRDGRLATMSWHRPGGEPMDAKVCFPGSFCARRPIHEARYRYDGPGLAVEMMLYDRHGKAKKTLRCAAGECF